MMPHNVYLSHEMPEEITRSASAIVCIAKSLATTKLQCFKSRLHLFQIDQLYPTITALYSHQSRLKISNSMQLCSSIFAYSNLQQQWDIVFPPIYTAFSLRQSYRLQVGILNNIAESITTKTISVESIENHFIVRLHLIVQHHCLRTVIQ